MSDQTFLGRLIGIIGDFFKKLWEGTKDAFEELPQEQQNAAILGTQLSQLLKDNFSRSSAYVVELVASKLGISSDVATGVILYAGKQLGVTEPTVQAVLDHFATRINEGIDDIAHNSLFKSVAEFAAYFFGTGKLNWITISLGIIEYAYQWLKDNNNLAKGLNTAADDGPPGGSTNPPPPLT